MKYLRLIATFAVISIALVVAAVPWTVAIGIALACVWLMRRVENSYGMKYWRLLTTFVVISIAIVVAAVPWPIAIGIALACVWLMRRVEDPYGPLLTSATVFAVFVLLELALRYMFPIAPPTYYRAHEMLLRPGNMNYVPNQEVDFHMPFGDLFAMSNYFYSSLPELRRERFYTDSLGFRNRHDYRGESIVLFGDSFVVGNGTDQFDILSEVLNEKYGLDVYNAGMSGAVGEYLDRFRLMERTYGKGFRAVFLIFEGNDFPCESGSVTAESLQLRNEQPALHGLLAERYPRALALATYVPEQVRQLESYRFFFGLTRRAMFRLGLYGRGDLSVIVKRVGPYDMGFWTHYIKQSTLRQACEWDPVFSGLKEIANRVDLIVFIPTKYRVYFPYLGLGQELPNAQWDYLNDFARSIGVRAVNLTQPLAAESAKLLEEGQYTFWRDDTHWNPHGIAVGARVIAEELRNVAQK